MSRYHKLSDQFAVSPQISVADVAEAATFGFGFIVNNRPDSEQAGQPTGAEIEAAALEAGLGYLAIPIDQSGLTVEQVSALSALMVSDRPILAYCRSGTRSTMLWALASAVRGVATDEIVEAAAASGYDVRGLVQTMEQLRGS